MVKRARLNVEEWNKWKHTRHIGRMVFKSQTPFQEGPQAPELKLAKAVRERVNGHIYRTGRETGLKRVGAWRIHLHAAAQILNVVGEIEKQAPLGTFFKVKQYYSHDRHVVNAVFAGEKTLLFMVRNWANPLHSSQLPEICEALNEIEEIIRGRQSNNKAKIYKVLFAPQLEGQGRETLDLLVNEDIYYYDLPYTQPKQLNEQVKESTGIDLDPFYGGPGNHAYNRGTLKRLFDYLWKFLLKRLHKKHTNQNREQDKPRFRGIKRISSLSLFLMNRNQSYRKQSPNQRDHPVEPSRGVVDKPKSMFLEGWKGPPKHKSVPPEPMKLVKISVEVKDPSLRARFSVTKKIRGKQGFLRERKYVEGPFFYKLLPFEDGSKKRIRVSLDLLRRLYGEKYALNHAVYALRQMKPRDPLVLATRNRALQGYLNRLRLIQSFAA